MTKCHVRTPFADFWQPALIQIRSAAHNHQSHPLSLQLQVCLCSLKFQVCTEHVWRKRIFRSSSLSSGLGGVLHNRIRCCLSIRWNYRCVRGVCAFSRPAVSHEVTSCGCEHHGSALYGRGGGFLTAAAPWGNKQGRGRCRGRIFRCTFSLSLSLSPSLALAPTASQPLRDLPRIWRLRIALSCWKVDVLIWPFIQQLRWSVRECWVVHRGGCSPQTAHVLHFNIVSVCLVQVYRLQAPGHFTQMFQGCRSIVIVWCCLVCTPAHPEPPSVGNISQWCKLFISEPCSQHKGYLLACLCALLLLIAPVKKLWIAN